MTTDAPGDAAALVEQQALSALGDSSAVVVTLGAFPPVTASVVPSLAGRVVSRVSTGLGLSLA